jgi:F0F1-type ATP synthase assembly protein I
MKERMTKKSEFAKAYAAGGKAVEGKVTYKLVLGGLLGAMLGELLKKRYSLPWFESDLIIALLVALLAFGLNFVDALVKRSARRNG